MAGPVEGSQYEEQGNRTRRHSQCADTGTRGIVRIDHQRQRDNADGVRDRDLGSHLQNRGSTEPQRIDDGENQRRGRRRDQDRVQRGVTGAECRRRTVVSNNRQEPDDNRANGTLADCRTNCRIADRDVW